MSSAHRNQFSQLIILAALTAPALIACSSQAWYQGVQASHEASCMKEPLSQYEECMKQNDDSYNEYEKNRGELSEDTAVKSK
jgi:hypothetical protein